MQEQIDVVITIHHFEDEPESVRWILGTLLNTLWLKHPDGDFGDGAIHVSPDRKEHSFVFRRAQDSSSIQVRHLSYERLEVFQQQFPEEVKPHDLVLLDLMSISPEGHPVVHGVDSYMVAVKRILQNRILFLTSYASDIPDDIREHLEPKQIWHKPVNLTAFFETLIGFLP